MPIPQAACSPGPPVQQCVLLDTNVVLDWLLFEDPVGRSIGELVASGRWRWLGTEAMRQELVWVLERPCLDRWADRRTSVLPAFDRWCTLMDAPTRAPGDGLRCTDPDDQGFIDLAASLSGAWLLSRDKAVLHLARRARARGLQILQPAAALSRWQMHALPNGIGASPPLANGATP